MKRIQVLRVWHISAQKLRSALVVPTSTTPLRCSFLNQTALKRVIPGILNPLVVLVIFGILFVLPIGIARAATAGCNDNDSATVCDILSKTCATQPDAAGCQDRDQTPQKNTIYGADGILTKAARLIAILVGIASIVMIMVGGFKYVLSSGDPASINSAKNTILYAVVGLVLSLIAQAIVLLVVNSL